MQLYGRSLPLTLMKVIIVEDSEDDLLLLLRILETGGYKIVHIRVETEEAFRVALQNGPWDLVISDHAMPSFSAPEALEIFKESGLDLPFIIVSETIGAEIAVAVMKAGADDCIMKGDLARLVPAMERGLKDAAIRAERKYYES